MSSSARGIRSIDPTFWAGRRVLVTGHTGFKGAWLTLWLQRLGATVIGFADGVPTVPSLFELARVADEMECLTGDICEASAVDRALIGHEPEVVIHLAAQSLVRRSFTEPAATYATNVIGTANLLDAARRCTSSRVIVVVTSDKCYERAAAGAPHVEEDPLGGSDPYSSSKACAELVVAAFRRCYFENPESTEHTSGEFASESDAKSDTRVATVRAGNVIGGGDWAADRLVADVMRAALGDTTVRVRNPHAVRPWQHVLNPLSGYLMLAEALWERPEYACPWNFGPRDEDSRPVEWIVQSLVERWRQPLDVRVDPGDHPPEASVLRLDSTRASRRLGWHPSWDLDRGLDAVVDWYKRLLDGEDTRDVTLGQIERFALDAATNPPTA